MSAQFKNEFEKEMMKAFEKAMGNTSVSSNTNSYVYTTPVTTWSDNTWSGAKDAMKIGIICGLTESNMDFIPTRVIFNPPATICTFPDGLKIVVKCAPDEEFVEEEGVMACIIKKIFKSRNAFKKLVASAYHQPKKEPKLLPSATANDEETENTEYEKEEDLF